jgi:hypothetical protein
MLYRSSLAAGWPLPARWTGYSQHAADTLPLPTRYLPARDVLQFRDAAFNTYFTNPSYIHMIERTFGAAAVDAINQMTAHTLTRDALAG